MSVTVWSFLKSFEDWTFALGPATTAGSSGTAVHIPDAIQITVSVPVSPPATRNTQGDLTYDGINATIANGDTIELDFGTVTGTSSEATIRVRGTYSDDTFEEILLTEESGPGTLTLTLTQSKTLSTIFVRCGIEEGGGARTETVDFLEVRFTTATPYTGTGERPLELDVDVAGGNKVWTSIFDTGSLELKEYSSSLVLQNTFSIATGTAISIIDINNRKFYLSPYAPPFFGTANLDDIIYVFGRYDDGTVRHLAKSTDGGPNFTDIGDSATWGADWVGAFFADDANTLFAFVNGASPALYRSTNAGTSWTNLSTLPFDVDPGGVSKHPDGRILIINRDAGAQMAAYAESPDYAVWIDATDGFPTDGGGANAIIWVT